MNKTLVLTLTATAAIGLAACESSPKSLPPGEYSKTQKSTNSDGTNYKKTTDTEVYYDENGNKRVRQEVETTKDPDGLFNKSTSKTTKTY